MSLHVSMRNVFVVMIVTTIGLLICSEARSADPVPVPETSPWDAHGPLRVAANGRYIEHADGTPMLWIADTGWALFYKLRHDEIIEYLDNRKAKGFNVVQAVLYWYPHGEDGPGPVNAPNRYGHQPFKGETDSPDTSLPEVQTGGSPDEPNDYWDNADFIVREVRKRGMYLAALPCWGRAYINPQMPGKIHDRYNELYYIETPTFMICASKPRG